MTSNMRHLVISSGFFLMFGLFGCQGPASVDESPEPGEDAEHDVVDGTQADDALDGPTPDSQDGASEDSNCVDCVQPPVFEGAWGEYGTEPGQFIEPSSVELHSDGVVIVAGHEDRIQRFTADGELIDIIGSAGTGEGEFDHPHGLAVDRRRGDLIYVGDQENGRVQVFDRQGSFVRLWGDALFDHIHDVGIDRETGDVFVPDLELDVVRKFTAEGELLATWGQQGTGPVEFNGPWGLSTDSEGFVYVADSDNQRIQKLDRDGTFVEQWTGYDGADFQKPTGVYVDEGDTVYVCDSLAETIVLFDTDGTVLEVWNLAEIYGDTTEPEDVVIDDEGSDIYVADVANHQVLHLVRE